MVNLKRWFRHTFMPPWRWRLAFPENVLSAIEQAITQSEQLHNGELRFAVENALLPSWIWRGLSAKQRATDVFSTLRVWDTEHNSGVLIYVLLADREVHVLADRGIAKRVTQAEWDVIANTMQAHFGGGLFQQGALEGVQQITTLLAKFFPPDRKKSNELPNKPVIIQK